MRFHLLSSGLTVAVLSLVLTACSGVPEKSANADQAAATTAAGNSAAAPFSSAPAEGAEAKPEKKGLFGKSLVPTSITVPAGTVVAVRLQNSVSSATASPGDTFEAVLDEPLVVKGQTVANR